MNIKRNQAKKQEKKKETKKEQPKKESAPKENKNRKIQSLIDDINKKFGNNAIRVGFPENIKVQVERIPTGSIILDLKSGGGIPIGRFTEISGNYSSSKGQPLDAILPTPNGDVKMGDLQVGDYVFGSDGKPTKVLGVYDRGVIDTYKVVFSDGSNIIVDTEHLWTLRRKDRPDVTIATKDLVNNKDLYDYYIPIVKPIEYNITNPDVIAYVLGRYLSSYEKIDIQPNINDYLKTVQLFEVNNEDKFIPYECFFADIDFRKSLLQGLLSINGKVYKVNKEFKGVYFKTLSNQLANDTVRLVTSLGGVAKKFKEIDEYIIKIITPFNTFHYINVFSNYWKFIEFEDMRKIIRVTPNGKLPIRCIRVEAKDQLYVADTKYHIVTHNTSQTLHIIANAQKMGLTCAYIDVEATTDEAFAKKFGVDFSTLIYSRPEGMEEALQMLIDIQKSGVVDVGVIDSIAMLSPTKEQNSDMDESVQLGIVPKLLGEYFRKYQALNNRLERENKRPFTVIGINQLRDGIGIYATENTTGGRAKNYVKSLDIRLRQGDWIKEGTGANQRVVGQVVKFKIEKNKTFKRMQTGEFDYYFDVNSAGVKEYHNDNIKELIICATDVGVIERGGSWFVFEDKLKIQGLQNVVDALKEDKELFEIVKAKTFELAYKQMRTPSQDDEFERVDLEDEE